MQRRPHHRAPCPDIFGHWVPVIALTASATDPIAMGVHDTMIERLERAYADLAQAPEPRAASWRDLTDSVNFLQSLIELEWATDEGGYIEAAKGALFQASEAMREHGKLRLTAPSLTALREGLDQFTELTRQIAARSYWVAVKHTKNRVVRLQAGQIKPGDVVVSV